MAEPSEERRVLLGSAALADVITKKVGKSGIIYAPSDWAGAEVLVVRQRDGK